MSTAQLERRLVALERAVEELKARVPRDTPAELPWWRRDAGRFRDDPEFEEIARLGAEYRRSLGPASMDLKIAAIAPTHGATLISRNLSDFRKVPGLSVEDWTAEAPR